MERATGISLYDIMRSNMKQRGLNTSCFSGIDIDSYFVQMIIAIKKLFELDFVHADAKIDNWIVHKG